MTDFVPGWDYEISIDDTSGTPRIFTGYASSADPTFEQDIHDTPIMGQAAKRVTPGQYGGSLTIEGNWHAQIEAWVGGPATYSTRRSVILYPAGNTSGNRRVSFEAYIASYNAPFAADDAGKFTLELTIDDAVTFDTVTP
jgi:hypothetical protein